METPGAVVCIKGQTDLAIDEYNDFLGKKGMPYVDTQVFKFTEVTGFWISKMGTKDADVVTLEFEGYICCDNCKSAYKNCEKVCSRNIFDLLSAIENILKLTNPQISIIKYLESIDRFEF